MFFLDFTPQTTGIYSRKRIQVKNNMVSSKNETIVLRMIYKSQLKCFPTTPAACGGIGSSVKRSENSFHRSQKANNNNLLSNGKNKIKPVNMNDKNSYAWISVKIYLFIIFESYA